MITGLDYFYDGQQRRFLEQVVRAFSGFKYETGWRGNTPPQQVMVPCRMAVTDRMVASILRNNSENTILSVPMITVFQTGLKGRREDLQNTSHEESVQVRERGVDPGTGRYTDQAGRSYTVTRLMPRPFEMTIQVDIWTANLQQKHQLSEQILTIIYPDFYIQNSDHALDWSAFTLMRVDDINWSSRSFPVGTESEIDIMTITLALPFWLSPPVKVTEQRVIHQIVTNILDGELTEDGEIDAQFLTRVITTPGSHFVRVEGGIITLLGPEAAETDDDDNVYPWQPLITQYGTLEPTVSTIRLKTNPDLDDWDDDIVGTIQFDALNPNQLLFQIDIDTLPSNTMPPVDAVIDPLRSWPGNGLPGAVPGRRYLVINDIGGSALSAWGTLTTRTNDIIEYQGGQWVVVFNANAVVPAPVPQYVLNLATGRQLRWNGYDWVLTIDGEYPPGMWRLSL